MSKIARSSLIAAALVLVVSLLSGCIVTIDDIGCHDCAPRAATLYIYVRDYYSGAPISWAHVELYRSDWWSWDYIGTWDVDRYGYARVRDGYLCRDDCGDAEEEDFLVVVRASGYCTEDYEIELSYYHPSETLTFYLVPCYGREAGVEAGTIVVGDSQDEDVKAPAVGGDETPAAVRESGTPAVEDESDTD